MMNTRLQITVDEWYTKYIEENNTFPTVEEMANYIAANKTTEKENA